MSAGDRDALACEIAAQAKARIRTLHAESIDVQQRAELDIRALMATEELAHLQRVRNDPFYVLFNRYAGDESIS